MASVVCERNCSSVEAFDHSDLEYDPNYGVPVGTCWWEDTQEHLLKEDKMDEFWPLETDTTTTDINDKDDTENTASSSGSYERQSEFSKICILDTNIYTIWGMEIIWEEGNEEVKKHGG